MEKIPRLPNAELEEMLSVWQLTSPTTSVEILNNLQAIKTWALPTLMTVLSRLVEKKFLKIEKVGRNNLYHVLITEKECQVVESKSLLNKLYGNSFTNFVATLFDSNNITKDDLKELKKYLKDIEK